MNSIRWATSEDIPIILGLVRGLADHVGESDKVTATDELLNQALFCDSPSVFCHVAEDPATGVVVGFSFWYLTFSTWLGKYGVWLDDLYVQPEFRGHGYGKALFQELQSVCKQRGYGRMEWTVYDWNDPARTFYQSHGAVPKDEFTVFRLDGDALRDAEA